MTEQFKITLAAARKNAGLTQKQLGKLMNKSESTIVKWESKDGSKKIRLEDLDKLCEILHIGRDQIFFE